MEENFKLENCLENDALEFKSGTYRIQKIIENIKIVLNEKLSGHLYEQLTAKDVKITSHNLWFTDGIDCEILKVGSIGWEKGKVRLKVSLEFIADEPEEIEPESPLDDIRKTINQ